MKKTEHSINWPTQWRPEPIDTILKKHNARLNFLEGFLFTCFFLAVLFAMVGEWRAANLQQVTREYVDSLHAAQDSQIVNCYNHIVP